MAVLAQTPASAFTEPSVVDCNTLPPATLGPSPRLARTAAPFRNTPLPLLPRMRQPLNVMLPPLKTRMPWPTCAGPLPCMLQPCPPTDDDIVTTTAFAFARLPTVMPSRALLLTWSSVDVHVAAPFNSTAPCASLPRLLLNVHDDDVTRDASVADSAAP